MFENPNVNPINPESIFENTVRMMENPTPHMNGATNGDKDAPGEKKAPPPKASIDYEAMLAACRVRLASPPQSLPIMLWIEENGKRYRFGTIGDISLASGKAKSGKSRFAQMLAAAAIAPDGRAGNVVCQLPVGKKGIVIFDTEQNQPDTWAGLDRIVKAAMLQTEPENIHVFSLRPFHPTERLAFIDKFLADHQSTVSFAIIDGIKDLVCSINDENEATELMTQLFKWATNYQMHIHQIIHQNMGSDKERGHLGTEAVNKSETTVEVCRDKETGIFCVKPKYCRGQEFPEFGFEIDPETGATSPVGVDDLPKHAGNEGRGRKPNANPSDFPIEYHREILEWVFAQNPKPKYAELQSLVRVGLERHGVKIGDSKARAFIAWMSKGINVLCCPSNRADHYKQMC